MTKLKNFQLSPLNLRKVAGTLFINNVLTYCEQINWDWYVRDYSCWQYTDICSHVFQYCFFLNWSNKKQRESFFRNSHLKLLIVEISLSPILFDSKSAIQYPGKLQTLTLFIIFLSGGGWLRGWVKAKGWGQDWDIY